MATHPSNTLPLRITIPQDNRDPIMAAKYGVTLDELSEFDGIEDVQLMTLIEEVYDDSTELVERMETGRQWVGDAIQLRKMEALAKKVYAEVMIRQAAKQRRRNISLCS